MKFDFSQVMESAASANNQEGSRNKYPFVYPGVGMTTVKLLFNPKSNCVFRLVNRHPWIEGTKVPCMKTYGKDVECPICKALEEGKNVYGKDLSTFKAKVRAICFAIFVSADYSMTGKNQPKSGDVVLLMVPWTVYLALQANIQRASTNGGSESVKNLIASNSGCSFSIQHSSDNKYQVILNAFGNRPTYESEEAYEKMMEDLDDLNDLLVPGTRDNIPEEIKQKVAAVSREIRSKYLEVGTIGGSSSSSEFFDTKGKPACYGKIDTGEISDETCLICPSQIECKAYADSVPF